MRKGLASLAAVVVIVSVVYLGGYVYDAYFVAPGPAAQETVLVIEPGDSVSEIARALEDGGVIKSALPFKLYVKWSGHSGDLQAGSFDLKTGMSYAAIVDAITSGGAEEVQVTIPEGYTLKQIGETVRAAIPSISEEEWDAAVGAGSPLASDPFIVAAGKPDSVDLEGYLFPDTYRFFSDASSEDVVKKMIGTMQEKAPGITHDQLTLASIVEREVQDPEDMKEVADIFLKRLDAGMALQADSTLSYITGQESAEMTTEDLQYDTPYNTYKYPGLPPGPISNPGMNAIDAVLHPTANDWYYFLTTPEGDVVYARTFEEHVANKNRYLR
jgi:UPF0755 protein